ncbi:MAG: hypothetical protein ACYCUI_15440 [Vulcanimicrobiaceae bacterium]
MFVMFSKRTPSSSSSISEFIRNSSSREKKRVYTTVLQKATERQNRVVAKAAVGGR